MNPQHQYEFKYGVLCGLAWVLIALVLLLISNLAAAANSVDRSSILFPYYETEDVLSSVATHHYAKDTAVLLAQLDGLNKATALYCNGSTKFEKVEAKYSQAYLSWLELSVVVMGQMLESNTVRQIDFRPLCVNLLDNHWLLV